MSTSPVVVDDLWNVSDVGEEEDEISPMQTDNINAEIRVQEVNH